MSKSDRAFRGLARAQPDFVAEMLRVLVPYSMPPDVSFTLDDMAPTQVDALPAALDADCIARVGEDEIRHVEFQGYNDPGFSERSVWYHVGSALRYRGKRRVRTVALWLTQLPPGQTRHVMRCDDITVRVKTVVLPNVPAAKLLANPKTVCLAAGANPGRWSVEELCSRVAEKLREHEASWPERHVAVVAAAVQGRYHAMVDAMDKMQLEPVIIEDLVRFGEERGEERGYSRGLSQGLSQGQSGVYANQCARRLRRPLTSQEHTALLRCIATLSADKLDDMMLMATPEAIEAWLAEFA